MTRASWIVSALVAAGCARTPAQTLAPTMEAAQAPPSATAAEPTATARAAAPEDAPLPLITRAADANPLFGKRVRVRGRAGNAKLSAIVTAEDFMVYCLDVHGWSHGVAGTIVTVEGVLERTDEFAARLSASGGMSQGTGGGDKVLRQCRRVDPTTSAQTTPDI